MKNKYDALDAQLDRQLQDIESLEAGSDEQLKAIKGACEIMKTQSEVKSDVCNRRTRVVDLGLTALGVVATAAIGLVGTRWRIEYEEQGVIRGRWYDELGKVVNIFRKKH